MKKYPIARPYITAREHRYVADVLDSGVLSLGPRQLDFERNFAKRIGTRYASAVSSGTAGLHLALLAAHIQKGDEVITTPFSFIASANAILYIGAKPVFVDIDPVTCNMDPMRIEAKITKRTRAILVVHIFGQSADMAPIMKIAKRHHLTIIEDACESVDASYRGKKVGTFGESAVFAFYPNKQLTTGEGGMIVTDDKDIYDLCCSLRNQGRAPDMQWLDHIHLGYNYRMTELSAALGLAQLEKLDQIVKARQRIAGWYHDFFSHHTDIIEPPPIADGNTHTWFVYVVRLKSGVGRDALIQKLAARGISTKPYLPSIHLFDFYKKTFGYTEGDFPISEAASRSSLALPFYIGLKKADVLHIGRTVIDAATNA